MNEQKNISIFFYTTILYLCGFFLFLEWLYPLEQVSDTTNSIIFVIYTFFCFFISLFKLRWWIGLVLKGFALLFILNGLYFTEAMLSPLWMEQLLMEVSFNLQVLFSAEWYYLTPMFRSFLFLLLIWLMSYLLYYWFVQMKRVFLFILLTFIYLAILDTFTVYDASISIIRVFVISFTALGIANLIKEMDREFMRFGWLKNSFVWLMPLLAIVFFSAMIGLAAPKAEPQWPDPVPFIQSTAENAGGGNSAVQKVGYGEDDSRLGGSFIQDDSPVFNAYTSENHYWRIETKDVYTGKGWISSSEPNYVEQNNGSIDLDTFGEGVGVEAESVDSYVEFYDNEALNKLVYPYGINEVTTGDEAQFFLDTNTEAIEARINGAVAHLAGYHLEYDHPSYEMNTLRNSTKGDPEEIMEQYTQVPDTLPGRVGDLAEEITSVHETRYDKTKAIERYFASNDYVYQTTDVPVPSANEDYVDQFLFDSQIGYCDNFSTSMVIMLRTLDIPARWAKGFTSGVVVDEDGSNTIYQVTNANAHSWVEVYFPETGWVPFEPTKGFSNLSDFHVDVDSNPEEGEGDLLEAPEIETPEQPETDLPEEAEADTAASEETAANTAGNINWWLILLILSVITVPSIFIYKTRYRWQTKVLTAKLHKNKDAETFQDAYHYLIKILGDHGYTRDPDQTLREFAELVDTGYSTDEMGQLTGYYEQMLYKNGANQPKINEVTQLWKNLIYRIMG
ncbi:transglutaminase TgpA family protein [Oceanobacillus damuensis]|uniref:transglutaminase TgpA family protein n=1 Tax=Oceanobacillus damuensis TaxID=937928 RepID=UPI000830EA71|nr:transglutaminase domain-containing protein [Oceanobacillus damuensis]